MGKELVCIVCPLGCRMEVSGPAAAETAPEVSGYGCERGKAYAAAEATNPRRVLPTTVRIRNAALPRLPVRTSEAIPKAKLLACMETVRRISTEAPVKIGDVIVRDICGTGADLIATRSMEATACR